MAVSGLPPFRGRVHRQASFIDTRRASFSRALRIALFLELYHLFASSLSDDCDPLGTLFEGAFKAVLVQKRLHAADQNHGVQV